MWLRSEVEAYIDLVVAEPLLHLVEQAAVSQLAKGSQVIIGCRGHQFHLKKRQRNKLSQ